MKRNGLPKDVRRIVKPLLREGYTIRQTGGGHWQLRAPNGADMYHLGATPRSGYRTVRNLQTWIAKVDSVTKNSERGTSTITQERRDVVDSSLGHG